MNGSCSGVDCIPFFRVASGLDPMKLLTRTPRFKAVHHDFRFPMQPETCPTLLRPVANHQENSLDLIAIDALGGSGNADRNVGGIDREQIAGYDRTIAKFKRIVGGCT